MQMLQHVSVSYSVCIVPRQSGLGVRVLYDTSLLIVLSKAVPFLYHICRPVAFYVDRLACLYVVPSLRLI